MGKQKDSKLGSEFPRTEQGKTADVFPTGKPSQYESSKTKAYGGKPNGNNAKSVGGKNK